MSGISIQFRSGVKNGEGGFVVTSAGIRIVSGEIQSAVTGGGVAGQLGLRISKPAARSKNINIISVGGRGILIKSVRRKPTSFFAESLAFNVGDDRDHREGSSLFHLRWWENFSPAITLTIPHGNGPGAFGNWRN